jgi:CopG antitoxin of type II toxin-antitoxin system
MKKAKRIGKQPLNEAQLKVFWDTHEVTPELLSTPIAPEDDFELPKSKSKLISLRLERDLDKRLRHLAKQKGTSYQTLLKEFVLERVYEEEKRLGII